MKTYSRLFLLLCTLSSSTHLLGQVSQWQDEIFWSVSNDHSIVWDLTREDRLPHEDNIEMAGERVAVIISYKVDTTGAVSVSRDVIFPQLRRFLIHGESSWQRYRAYLRTIYEDDILPAVRIGTMGIEPGPVDSIRIDGTLRLYHSPFPGLSLERHFAPSMTKRECVEIWKFLNSSDSTMTLSIGSVQQTRETVGQNGRFTQTVRSDGQESFDLKPSATYGFGIYMTAQLNDEPEPDLLWTSVLSERETFLNTMRDNLILESPDPVLNTLFLFSKIRAAESIYDTDMGLVHSPGGGRYYTGVWANDQCEYSGPFFPYLGYNKGNTAAMNAYRQFARNIPEGDGHFWSSFEMNNTLTCCGGDRGDAAMIAYGASQYALSSGDPAIGEELWPLIEWSLEYCERQKTVDGVIGSDTDEMEGRIPTGSANLSTSSLTYGALIHAADLSAALSKDEAIISTYRSRAADLKEAIEKHFGAEIEGLETYRYYKGHDHLRHWICLPLVMDIHDRKTGTLNALFSKLWTANGVRVEYNPSLEEPDLFWDRGTLYAFRGAFRAGASDRSLDRLQSYSSTRLLGFHVPYVVEAWPEGNMAHLSAESALYCRIFTEGMFGLTPESFRSMRVTPQLPQKWESVSLRRVHSQGETYDITLQRAAEGVAVSVDQDGTVIFSDITQNGESVVVRFR